MADPEHVEVVMRGAAAITEWRQENPGVVLDLSGANFRYVNLRGADLILASLTVADLSGAHLRRRLAPPPLPHRGLLIHRGQRS